MGIASNNSHRSALMDVDPREGDVAFLLQMLEAFRNPDNDIRGEAEQTLFQLQQSDPDRTVALLLKIIASHPTAIVARQAFIELAPYVLGVRRIQKPDISLATLEKLRSQTLAIAASSNVPPGFHAHIIATLLDAGHRGGLDPGFPAWPELLLFFRDLTDSPFAADSLLFFAHVFGCIAGDAIVLRDVLRCAARSLFW
jgi:hypothetical protein